MNLLQSVVNTNDWIFSIPISCYSSRFYLFEPFHVFMLGWSNNDEGFEIHLGIGAIVFLEG